jgi:hypothetical protein
MRVADLDVLYTEMREELNEMAIGDEFKSGFLYAMGIVKRERGIKLPRQELTVTSTPPMPKLRSDAE